MPSDLRSLRYEILACIIYVHLFGSGADIGGGCCCIVAFCAVINKKLITIMNKFKARYMLASINATYVKSTYVLCVRHIRIISSSTKCPVIHSFFWGCSSFYRAISFVRAAWFVLRPFSTIRITDRKPKIWITGRYN